MPPPSISPQSKKERDAKSRKKFPGIRHPLLLSFLAGKLAFKHIYKDDDSLYEAIKSTPVFAKCAACRHALAFSSNGDAVSLQR